MTNAIEAVKAELKNSSNIEETAKGFVVWDDFGMIISNEETLEKAVDALFAYSY